MEKGCKDCGSNASSVNKEAGILKTYIKEIITGFLLVAGILFGHYDVFRIFGPGYSGWIEILYYIIAILPVGIPVVREMFESWRSGSVMNEFTLMVAASVGAFIIGEYPEAVAVLLFYSFGEKMEDTASDDVKARIKSFVGRLPDKANVIVEKGIEETAPKMVTVGTRILVRAGERVPVDARLEGDISADFDTSAISGESVPRTYRPGDELPSGIIPVDRAVEAVTIRPYDDSSMSRIMKMIEDAQAQKSPTETMLRRITRWYTPVVFLLALLLFVIPWIVSLASGATFEAIVWFRRSLVFLVCSCPCALVVSIPLSYYISLGVASGNGLLFKGSKYIDVMRRLRSVVFDKTGTLTTGKFQVSVIDPEGGHDANEILAAAAAIDADSSHPLAIAICAYANEKGTMVRKADDVVSISHGMRGRIDGKDYLVGSVRLMSANHVDVPESRESGTRICVAVEGTYTGSIYLEDTVKKEAREAVGELHKAGVKNVMILSGDRYASVDKVAREVGADSWKAELLPEDKQEIVISLRNDGGVAFVGDGINDAPAIAASDIGVAMGTMGTGIAMDSADVVIAGDNLMRLPLAMRLARKVKETVVENVSFAVGIKVLVMGLGAFGIATLWAAVFADTGVTLITILWTMFRLRKI